jgi:Arc/MetJ-type ribon-helix-helix transcriptional regulator
MIYYRYIRGWLMSTSARLTRQKISTTISPTALSYLERLIEKGEAQNLAEAIDLAIDRLLAFENRERLENDTAAYFANLTEKEAAEERALETALSQSATGIDFDS